MMFFWNIRNTYNHHPLGLYIIHLLLDIAAKPSAVYGKIWYDEKYGTGWLTLPSRYKLRDCKITSNQYEGFIQTSS